MKLILRLSGLVLLVLGCLHPLFRDSEGYLDGLLVVPLAAGVSLIVLGWAIDTGWRTAAAWFSLALIGQAVALQLIEAGTSLHYQHYQPLGRILQETSPILLVFLAGQSVLVAGGLARRLPHIARWLRGQFKLWRLVAIGLLLFFSAAAVSPQPAQYFAELAFATCIQLLNLATVLLAAWAVPEDGLAHVEKVGDRWLGRPEAAAAADGNGGRLDRFALLAALWVAAVSILLSLFIYERHPHIPDEAIYLIQARYLANGVWSTAAPPVPEAFEMYLMDQRGEQWFPVPPPGWPAMLALGTRVGLPWLVNPLLAGANVLLAYLFLQELFDRRLARVVLLFLCVSPWFIFMGMNFMTHTFTLTCALIAAIGVAWSRRKGSIGWALAAGVTLGMMSLIRPLEALVLAGLLGLWAIGLGGRRLRLPALAALVVGALAVATAMLPYNQALTGDASKFPIMVYTDERYGPNANALGFGPDRGLGWPIDPFPGHSPRDGVINASLNAFSTNIELLGWSSGSLLLIALLVVGPLAATDWLMLAVVTAVFGAHFFYYFSGGPDFGARYWYLMILPLLLLTARGLRQLRRRLAGGRQRPTGPGTRAAIAVAALCLMALVNYFPWRALDKYHHYQNMRPEIVRLAEEHDFGRDLVLVRGDNHPDYVSAAIYNPMHWQADAPIYAWDRSDEIRQRLLAYYSDRDVWLVDGPTITQRGYEIAAGPLPAATLLTEGGEAESRVPTGDVGARNR